MLLDEEYCGTWVISTTEELETRLPTAWIWSLPLQIANQLAHVVYCHAITFPVRDRMSLGILMH